MAQGVDNKTGGGGGTSSVFLEPSPRRSDWGSTWFAEGFWMDQWETLPWLQLLYHPLCCTSWLQGWVQPSHDIPRRADEYIAAHFQRVENAALPEVSLLQPTFSPKKTLSSLRLAFPFHNRLFYKRVIFPSSKHLTKPLCLRTHIAQTGVSRLVHIFQHNPMKSSTGHMALSLQTGLWQSESSAEKNPKH